MQLYLVGHLALEVHSQFDHVVVRRSGKEDFARVQLVQSAAHGPHVDPVVIRLSYNCSRTGM